MSSQATTRSTRGASVPHRRASLTGWRAAVVAAVVVQGVGQGVTVAVAQALAHARHEERWAWMSSWDAQFFLRIAAHGYASSFWAAHLAHGSPLAFFPGLPACIAVVHAVSGLPLTASGVLTSELAGVAFALGALALARGLGAGPRTAVVVVALASTGPMAITFSMPYTEALFCAMAVWVLVLTQRGRWLSAGALCALAGTVRPTGAALALAVMAAAAWAFWRDRAGVRAVAAAVLAPAGTAGYLAWVAWRTGDVTGWFAVQRAEWDTRFDGGRSTYDTAVHLLVDPRSLQDDVTLAAAVAALLLLVLALADRLWWPALLYAAGVLALDLGSAGLWTSKVRLLIPAFPLLLPIASRLVATMVPAVELTRAPRSATRGAAAGGPGEIGAATAPRAPAVATATATLAGCAIVALWSVAGAWYSAYALIVSGRAP